jgi:peptidyl-prolyl cis-trans isomerase SurA
MIRKIILAAGFVPAVLAAQIPVTPASSTPAAIPLDRVVAIVGDQTLLLSDVLTTINQRRAQGMTLPPDSAGQAALAHSVLNELVDEELLCKTTNEMKLEVTDADVISAADRQIKSARGQFARRQ